MFGDGEGRAQIFGDRDCSVQRRHQKLIEECPAPGLSVATRAVMHDASRALVQALAYRGAGTVEFLVDTQSEAVVFLEVNARIQVEHPVTEEAYGIDRWPLNCAWHSVGTPNFPTFLRSLGHGHRTEDQRRRSRERFPAQPRHD